MEATMRRKPNPYTGILLASGALWLLLWGITCYEMAQTETQGMGIIPLNEEEVATILTQKIPNAPTVWVMGTVRWDVGEHAVKEDKALTKSLVRYWGELGMVNVNPSPVDMDMEVEGPCYIAMVILFADKEDSTKFQGVAYTIQFADPAGNLHDVQTVFTEDKVTPKNYRAMLTDLEALTKAFAYQTLNHYDYWQEQRLNILQQEGLLNDA
jgi:hypothetical protein